MNNNSRPWFRQVACLLCLLGLGLAARTLFVDSAFYESWFVMDEQKHWSSFLILASVYMLLLSVPFLPGIELGILLMCLAGSEMVIIVYLATLLGLTLSFAMGRWLPLKGIRFFLRRLKPLQNQEDPSKKDLETSGDSLFMRKAEKILGLKLMRFARKNPYLMTGLLLNLPGNFIIGGGGGIAMISGLNRRISLKYFVLTIALATLPLPLLVLLGYVQLEPFL